jgi:hypothetical protein
VDAKDKNRSRIENPTMMDSILLPLKKPHKYVAKLGQPS